MKVVGRGLSLALAAIVLLLVVSVVFATGGDSYWGLLRIGGEQSSDEWVGRGGVADPDLFIGGTAALYVSIVNFPGSFDFGTLSASETSVTGLTYFTVTNNGGVAVDITIEGADMTGNGITWTLSDDGNNGAGIYGLLAGRSGESYNIVVKRTSPYNGLKANLGVDLTQDWGMQTQAPSSGVGNVVVSGTTTLTATEYTG